VEVASRL